ncbi:MAG TPA: UDP-N-acetylglucosamine--N-acetylmuramyl-(pentapeptide) pyrophosphoryl-undecaprenol N-acetylglucosamine transferase [Candidatus Saccharimonadales bacterium]
MSKTIVLTGAGSGGHITPLLAVAAEIKRRDSSVKLVYIGQTGDKLGDIPANDPNIDETYTVRAGKFRRYHGEGLRQLLDIPTLLLNIRDAFYVLIGLWQSRRLLKRLQPDVIFIKGGFVGVPVGLAAAHLHIPFITHDSDAIPGLANRIIARWATVHAVALPAEVYAYPKAQTVTTGIPLQADFVPVTPELVKRYRAELGLPISAKVLFIIGGGLGSQRVNKAVAEAVPHLLHEFADLRVIHVVGRQNEADMKAQYAAELSEAQQGRVQTLGYITDVYRYSGAADVIITRAGATNLAEFAVQGRACIVVPSPFLTGGHQLKNAQYLADKQAAEVISETDLADDSNRLAKQVSELLSDHAKRQLLARNLAQFAQPHATRDLAKLILDHADKRSEP